MPDEAKTDGTGSATGTQTPGAKTATDGGNEIPAGVQGRIDGITAERNRWKEKAEAESAEKQKLIDQHKTDDQKRIDAAAQAIVDAQWKPKGEYWTKVEADMKTELDALFLLKIPEDAKAAISASLPVYDQLRAARVIMGILEKKGGAVTTAASPAATGQASTYTREQWDAFAALARTDPKKYNELKPEMFAAAHEGRVTGLRQGV